ncbi:MAG: carbohydrate kinase family protein [Kiritimatiellaeota bacterium]|nr:carbohydrate kinase family protein [Kiritimatiellota bacterium]
MKKKILSWGTCMCDIIAPEMQKVAEPGVIEYLPRGIELRLGGHPVDLIIDLARIGVDPNEIAVVSTIGTDVFGDFLLREIAGYGFQAYIERVAGGTGKTIILALKDQDRLCHLDPAACMRMALEHLEGVIRETEPEFFTFRPGYTNLDLEMAPLLKRLRAGPLKNSFLLLDLCAPYKKEWSYYLELLPQVDAVHGNSKEIIRAGGENTFEKATKKMFLLGAKSILLTKEAAGAELLTPHYRITQPSFNIKFVEPSGSGDAFCAGIIHALAMSPKNMATMNGNELADVLVWGQALGAAAATQVGCVEGVTKSKVQNLLDTQKQRILDGTVIEKKVS